MATIKNIIFDLGGVLLDIDYYRTSQAFKELGVKKFDDFYSQASANELFEALETGDVSEEKFYATMQQYCVPGTAYHQVQAAWNAMLLSFRKESVAFLSPLKEKYNLFLLSNTNSIHLPEFNEIYRREIGGLLFDDHFITSYYSHLMHRRKPYSSTYQFVLEDAGIRPEETLFIDDSYKNIDGAKVLGIQTHLLLPEEKIEALGL
jgi:glucose-1-phosphatase